MDDEIEDMVGDVKYTDSQKSVATLSSIAYTLDFTDAGSRCSEKNLSSGKNTYVIECDSEDSDNMFPLHCCGSEKVLPVQDRLYCAPTDTSFPITSTQCGPSYHSVTQCATTSYHPLCSIVAHETFTQTSKTIIELAETEGAMRKTIDSNNLQTQTSFVSITENRTVEYRIQVSNVQDHLTVDEIFVDFSTTNSCDQSPQECILYDITPVDQQGDDEKSKDLNTFDQHQISVEFENESSNFPVSETDVENDAIRTHSEPSITSVESPDEILKIIDDNIIEGDDDVNDENVKLFLEENCDEDYDDIPSDIEDDSLMQELPKDKDVEELRDDISEASKRFRVLTPLTEETAKKDSLSDLKPPDNVEDILLINDELLFTNDTGMKVKLLKEGNDNLFKLPPIHNNSCPTSPHNSLSLGQPKFYKAGTLPSLHEGKDRWELSTKTLAAGESTLIRGRSESRSRRNQIKFHLPPINGSGNDSLPTTRSDLPHAPSSITLNEMTSEPREAISIKEKIKELKMTKPAWSIKQNSTRSHSGNVSPSSSPERVDIANIAHLGCEAICAELLKRLRDGSWYEIVETLEEIPSSLEKFWRNITEMRIADLLRQVNIHVESPRPPVARAACGAVATILKNTNYTKKPDFYETISLLLTKTGSYSRLVRRSANLALDNVVCAVDMTQAITALCMHGVDHKNALVRCAAARLLVVCCALGGAGRKLLRARPPTAATARRHTLKALAVLLDDKSTETRKYAERLYSMLRQLANFEAYYLTDVAVETATRQMKKYDQLLTPKDAR